MTRALVALVALAGCRDIDGHIRAERERMLALSPDLAHEIVAFCATWKGSGSIPVNRWPRVLRDGPTTAEARGGEIVFAWSNDDEHPHFAVACTATPRPGDRALAAGLVLRE